MTSKMSVLMWSALTQTCEIARLEIDQLLSLSDVPIRLWPTTWSKDLNNEDNFKQIYDQMSVSFLLEQFFFLVCFIATFLMQSLLLETLSLRKKISY